MAFLTWEELPAGLSIRGRFIGQAPYFAVHLRATNFQGLAWLLADTGASRTTLLDRDAMHLGITTEALEPAPLPIVGVGGSVRSFLLRGVEITLPSEKGDVTLRHDLWIAQHDLLRLPSEEVARILRLPSLLGRDVINNFRLTYDYRSGVVLLER